MHVGQSQSEASRRTSVPSSESGSAVGSHVPGHDAPGSGMSDANAKSGSQRQFSAWPEYVRAGAISLVLVYHAMDHIPSFPQWMLTFSEQRPGVTLFFVLSGWLIGGSLWREQARTGAVNTPGFLARRWMRTVPPYLVFMLLVYAAVCWMRGEALDWRYLVFAKNYLDELPFFLISWSLSVQEQMYVVLPLLIIVLRRRSRFTEASLLAILALSATARLLDPTAIPAAGFGYAETATHLNLTGVMVGVYLSFLATHQSQRLAQLKQISARVLIVTSVLFATAPFWEARFAYWVSSPLVSLWGGAMILTLSQSTYFSVSRSALIRVLSQWSYSLYLTHSMVLSFIALLTTRLDLPMAPMMLLALVIMLPVGALGYYCVEVPSLRLRDRWFSRRPTASKVAAA